MEKQLKIKIVVREVIKLIVRFFKPYKISDEILAIPKNVKWMGFKVSFFGFVGTIISMLFAFMLKATNSLIEQRLILLGIILFMLYRGQQIVKSGYSIFRRSEDEKFSRIFEDEIVLRGSKLIGNVAGKVLKYDEKNKIYKIMDNEEVINSIKTFLKKFWTLKIEHIFEIYDFLTVLVMLIISVITNTAIPQKYYIPLIIVFVLISIFSSAYKGLKHNEFYKVNKKYDNQQSIIIHDLLHVPAIVRKDLDMRIGKYQQSVVDSNKNIINYFNKTNFAGFFETVLEISSQYGIIIFYLLGVDWNSITLATIAEITATLAVVEMAISQVKGIFSVLEKHSSNISILEEEEQTIKLILDVYHVEINNISNSKKIDEIDIEPFSIKYKEESENDKPFTLVSKNKIHFEKGEVAVLYGPSGSGKSTFMKMLTQRIRLEKSTEIPSTSRFLFYDEKLRFGSFSLFEEIFCCDENPDFEKMQLILENLHLWKEIKSNCVDVWKFFQEKRFEHTLSNGQKQRLILAKMLYWLDDEIDVLVLDESTSGLDDKSDSDSADAEKILEYIVRYANKDKKRIVIISTHQNIDGFKERIAEEYKFKNLFFVKEGEANLVKEL